MKFHSLLLFYLITYVFANPFSTPYEISLLYKLYADTCKGDGIFESLGKDPYTKEDFAAFADMYCRRLYAEAEGIVLFDNMALVNKYLPDKFDDLKLLDSLNKALDTYTQGRPPFLEIEKERVFGGKFKNLGFSSILDKMYGLYFGNSNTDKTSEFPQKVLENILKLRYKEFKEANAGNGISNPNYKNFPDNRKSLGLIIEKCFETDDSAFTIKFKEKCQVTLMDDKKYTFDKIDDAYDKMEDLRTKKTKFADRAHFDIIIVAKKFHYDFFKSC